MPEEEAGPQGRLDDDSPFRPVASSRPYERGQRKSNRLIKVCFFLGVLVTAIGLIVVHIFTSYLIPSPDNICDAARDGNLFKVKLLLWRDPDLLEVRNFSRETPLFFAACWGEGEKETIEYLISKGADVDARDREGETPLFQVSNGEIAKVLLKNGANINARNNEGEYPLHAARNAEVARVFIENGADLMAKDYYGSTPLHKASSRGWGGWPDVAEVLIEKGADVNARDGLGRTPLHAATYEGKIEIVIILLEAGADPNVKDDDGDTPLSAAIEGKHTEVADLLRQHGAKQ